MKRKCIFAAEVCFIAAVILAACQNQEGGHNVQKNPVSYAIVSADQIDDVLMEAIEKYKHQHFQLTYEDNGKIWAAVGYGQKPTAGYSIAVDEVYEYNDRIHIKTSVIGPQKSDRMPDEPTCPYIIIMIDSDFDADAVVFETP